MFNHSSNNADSCFSLFRAALRGVARDRRGAVGVEYALLAGIAGIALIGSLTLLGDEVEETMTGTAQVMTASATGNAGNTGSGRNAGNGTGGTNESGSGSGSTSSDDGMEGDGGGAASGGDGGGQTTAHDEQKDQEEDDGEQKADRASGDDRPGDDGASDTASADEAKGRSRDTSGAGNRVGDDCGRNDSRSRDARCDSGNPGRSDRKRAGRG